MRPGFHSSSDVMMNAFSSLCALEVHSETNQNLTREGARAFSPAFCLPCVSRNPILKSPGFVVEAHVRVRHALRFVLVPIQLRTFLLLWAWVLVS